jgi:hypothetical protein
MRTRVFAMLVLCASAPSAPSFAQTLTPVAPHELSTFIGHSVLGRFRTHIALVSAVDRNQGTITVIAMHGEVATLPVGLLGRSGLQLRAPAVTLNDIARASNGGQSRIPLRGEVTVTEDEVRPSSIE